MKHISELLESNKTINILVDVREYNLQDDKRFLVPFMVYEHNEIRYGFMDKDGNIVVDAIYDKVFDDFYSADDVVRVGKRYVIDYGTKEKPNQYTYFHYGFINSKGEEVIACKYDDLYFAYERKLLVACSYKQRALLDSKGQVIIPFGKYLVISCFVNGYSCVGDWHKGEVGIIDTEGNCIVPIGIFDSTWRLDEKYPHIVVQKNGVRYILTYEALDMLQREFKEHGKTITPIDTLLHYDSFYQQEFIGNGLPLDATNM